MKTTSRSEKMGYSSDNALRCGARIKNNKGDPCGCLAIKGKARCRVHGGAKRSGAPQDNLNALKHGETTGEAKAFKLEIRQAIRLAKEQLKELG